MDFNGNVSIEQRDRSEESQPNTLNGIEKVQHVESGEKKNQRISWRKSSDSLEIGGSQNFVGNQQYRKASRQRENYEKMYEHGRDSEASFSDGNQGNFTGENIWEHRESDLRYDNYEAGNGATGCDVNRANHNPYRNCKSGINISVVSRQENDCENAEMEKPMYSVSFKRCHDKIGNVSCQQSTEETGNFSSYRCTFENCCRNCEPYIMEIRNNECNSHKNWQNSDFEPRNLCFEDCCCPRDMKVYSSNLSVRPRQSCMACVENEKCCPPSSESKCEYLPDNCHTSSKHCLQRVHFAKAENSTKTNHSSCSCCSRKCTPSKASLFVEIGESVADVCNLTSAQVFSRNDSMVSLKDTTKQGAVKRNKSDLLKRLCKSKKSEPKCSSSCKGRPGAMARSYSDQISCLGVHADDCAGEQMPQEVFCAEMLTSDQISNMNFQAQTDKSTVGCSQQCETNEHSLLEDIRKGLQDTYRSFVKVATTSISQIVKQSSKLKRSKKCSKDRPSCGTCTKARENDILCIDQCNQSESCNECVYEGTCWNQSNNCEVHCCRNICYENMAGLPACQTPVCQSACWTCSSDMQEQVPSRRDWDFNPSNSVSTNVYSSHERVHKDVQHFKYGGRKRGGADSNQSKRQIASNRGVSQNPMESRNSENTNSGNQVLKRQTQFLPQDHETERATVHIDVSVQKSAVRTAFDPYMVEDMSYQKRITTIKRLGTYSDAASSTPQTRVAPSRKRDGPVIQEIDSTLHSLPHREESKTTRRPIPQSVRKPIQGPQSSRNGPTRPVSSPKPRRESTQKDKPDRTTKQDSVGPELPTSEKGVQCELIKEHRLVCGSECKGIATQAERLCFCKPIGATIPQETPEKGESKETPAQKVTSVETEATKDTTEEARGEFTTQTAEGDVTEKAPITEEAPVTEKAPITEEPPTTEKQDSPKEPEAPDDTASIQTTDTIKPAEESIDTPIVSEISTETSEEKRKEKLEEKPQEITQERMLAPMTEQPRELGKMDPAAPIEFTKEVDGRRTHVSVQMQTSNTILTQILSEFQIGNKKRQVLMSIRLQTNLDGSSEAQQSSRSNDTEVQTMAAKEQPRTSDDVVYDHQRRMKWPASNRSAHPKTRKPRDVYGTPTLSSGSSTSYQKKQRTRPRRINNDSSQTKTSNGYCSGPCRRKRV